MDVFHNVIYIVAQNINNVKLIDSNFIKYFVNYFWTHTQMDSHGWKHPKFINDHCSAGKNGETKILTITGRLEMNEDI